MVIAIVCVAMFLAGRFLFRSSDVDGSRSSGPAAVRAEERPTGARADLATPQSAPTRSGARTLTDVAGEAPSQEAPEGETAERETERDARHEAWELLARLEHLARTPQTFHAAALPVIDRLTEVCSTPSSPQAAASGQDSRSVVAQLQRVVIADPARDTLVRGAVFLALAPALSEPEFWGTFTEWVSGHPGVPLELVRAAALASARVGSPSPCESALPLAKLSELPTLGSPDLPGCYPLALDRIASGRACDALRRWLDLDDPRKSLFKISNGAPPADADLAAAGEYFVTVEVLLCVWGHRSLEDTLVERALLSETEITLEDLPERSLVSLRAAHFVVLSLAPCNTAFFDAAVAMTSESDAPMADFVSEMQGVLGEALGSVTIERLERLRYSERSIDEAELTLALDDLREGFLRGDAHDPEQRAVLLDYVSGLVSDPGLSWIVRVGAVQTVASGGSWEAMRTAAAAALQPGAPLILSQMTLPQLLAAAGSDPDQRAEALELLQQFAALSPTNAAKLNVDSYIADLTQ